MKWQLAALTDPGRVRTNNEDACLVDEEVGLLVVADGMGGHAAGEVASGLAVDVVRSTVTEGVRTRRIPSVDGSPLHLSTETRLLHAAVVMANQVVFQASQERVERRGMGTTLVAALLQKRRISVAHVGDSRMYLYREGALKALTRDHSLVEEQVSRGLISREEAEKSDVKNILTRALGIAAAVDVDLSEPAVRGGDLLVLCSDGLTKMMDDADLARALNGLSDPAKICHHLVDLSLERGGRDNVTVAVGKLQRNALWNRLTGLWRRTNPAEGGDTHG